MIGAFTMVQRKAIFYAIALCLALPSVSFAQNAGKTTPSAAPAQASTKIPEPGDFALFVIGVAGLVIGRWSSRSRKRKRQEL